MNDVTALVIPKAQYEVVVAHCLSERPYEACGLLLGKGQRVSEVHPAANALRSPTGYAVDPQEQLKVIRHGEARGLEMVAIYHSHVETEPYPSFTDVNAARESGWDVFYLIIGTGADPPTARVFRLVGEEIAEQELDVAG